MTRPNAQVSLRASNEDECLGGLRVCVNSVAQSLVKKGLTFTQRLVPWHLWFSESGFSRYTSKVPGAYTFSRKKQTEAFICHLYQNELQRALMWWPPPSRVHMLCYKEEVCTETFVVFPEWIDFVYIYITYLFCMHTFSRKDWTVPK